MSITDFEPDIHEREGCPMEAVGRALRVLWALTSWSA
jgi:hypothetical protein